MKNIFFLFLDSWPKEGEPTALKRYYVAEYENRDNLVRRTNVDDWHLLGPRRKILWRRNQERSKSKLLPGPRQGSSATLLQGHSCTRKWPRSYGVLGRHCCKPQKDPLCQKNRWNIYPPHCPPSHLLSLGQDYQGQGIMWGLEELRARLTLYTWSSDWSTLRG